MFVNSSGLYKVLIKFSHSQKSSKKPNKKISKKPNKKISKKPNKKISKHSNVKINNITPLHI